MLNEAAYSLMEFVLHFRINSRRNRSEKKWGWINALLSVLASGTRFSVGCGDLWGNSYSSDEKWETRVIVPITSENEWNQRREFQFQFRFFNRYLISRLFQDSTKVYWKMNREYSNKGATTSAFIRYFLCVITMQYSEWTYKRGMKNQYYEYIYLCLFPFVVSGF